MDARTRKVQPDALPFGEASLLLKALGHPLRLRLVCGLSREPSNLTRIVGALGTPLSTIALHLAVLRRQGILEEERRGSEIVFRVGDPRVHGILDVLCRAAGNPPRDAWDWGRLARGIRTAEK